MVLKFIFVLLSKNISKIRHSKSCIFYYIIYTTMEALLYQPLRFILTFKSNRSMVSFWRKHCKYDMHKNFHTSFLGIAFKYFIDDKDYTAQSFGRTIDFLFVSINHCPQHVLYSFLLMCNAFIFFLIKQDIKKTAVLILILYHLFILMFI